MRGAGSRTRGLSADEREAVAARKREAQQGDTAGEAEVLEKLAGLPEPDRHIGQTLHALIRTHAPALVPRTWYGMPAYARDDGKVVCFFQPASKFKTRYGTLGFSDKARLDDGALWPIAFALTALGPAEEKRIIALLKQALG